MENTIENAVISENVNILTNQGACDAVVCRPRNEKECPAVILYMDAFGVRDALVGMAKRLSSHGYFVLLPNLFYRFRPAPVLDVHFPMKAEDRAEAIKQIMPLINGYTHELAMKDAQSFLNFLTQQKEVKPGPVGVIGYCMGGGLAIRVAANFPDRIASVASFHAGRLVTDAPESPHKLLASIKGEIYVAHADNDQSMPPESIQRFDQALRDSHVKFSSELYEGAAHGFTMPDMPVYNQVAAQRHWQNLLDLLSRTFKVAQAQEAHPRSH